MYRKPNYYFLAFGDQYAPTHPVEGGVFPHRKDYNYVSNSGIAAGDVMILYCCDYYPGHDKEAPGIGVVLGIETINGQEIIRYQYFPFSLPLDWDTIKVAFPELENNSNFSLSGNWLRPISNQSFLKAINNQQIDWS